MIFIPYCVCLVIIAGKKGIGIFSAWLVVSGLGSEAVKSLEVPLSARGPPEGLARGTMGQHVGGNGI